MAHEFRMKRLSPLLFVFLILGFATISDAANNVADLAQQLAAQLKIPAADPLAAVSALKSRGIIPAEAAPASPVTSPLAQAITAGLIKAGQAPPAAARMLAFSAASAAVPLLEAVQGAVSAGHAAGADVGAVTQAATQGAVQGAAAQVAGPMTKGRFIERFFLNKDTRPPAAAAFVPEGGEALPPDRRYGAVAERLASLGEKVLEGTKPGDSLGRAEYVVLSYLLEGGQPGAGFGEKKAFLKKKGVLDPEDIGLIKSFQGQATVTRAGTEKKIKVTGAEPVLFKDAEETEQNARLELLFDDGSTLTVSEDTAITIDEMVYRPENQFRSITLRIRAGAINIKGAPNSNPDSKFQIITPTLVAGVRGTEGYVTVEPSGQSRIHNTGGVWEARGVSRQDNPPAPQRPEPGPPRPLPATPAQVAPPVSVTLGNTTQAAVGTSPSPPVPTPPQQLQAAAQRTAITNPASSAAVSLVTAAAGAAAQEAAKGSLTAASAAGANTAAAAEGAASGALVAAKASGADLTKAGRDVSQGLVEAAATTGLNMGAVADAVGSGVVKTAQALGENVAEVTKGASQGAIMGAQAKGVSASAVAEGIGRGAVTASQAAGADVGGVARGVGTGAAQGAQVSGADVGSASEGAAKGAVSGAAGAGGNVGAAAQGAASGIVSGTQGLGGETGKAVEGATKGAISAGAGAGADVGNITQGLARAVIQTGQQTGADIGQITQNLTQAAIQSGQQAGANVTQITQNLTQTAIQAGQQTGADMGAITQNLVRGAGAAGTAAAQAMQQSVTQTAQQAGFTPPPARAAEPPVAETLSPSKTASPATSTAAQEQKDLGAKSKEIAEAGAGTLTTASTPITAESAGLVLATAPADVLIFTFLAFPPTVQAVKFGELPASQQDALIKGLTPAQGEKLLGAFQPASPFTPEVSKSLRDFWSAVERVRADLEAVLTVKVSSAQASELLPARPLGKVASFYNGLATAAQNSGEVLAAFSGEQAAAVVPTQGAERIAVFFNGLLSSVRAAAPVLANLSAGQTQILIPNRPPGELAAFYNGLSSAVRTNGTVLGVISGTQAAALIPGRPVAEVAAFFDGLSSAVRTNGTVLGVISGAQAAALIGGRPVAEVALFFEGLSSSVRGDSAVMAAIPASQAAALIAGRPVAEVAAFFDSLSPSVRASGALLGAIPGPQAAALLAGRPAGEVAAFFDSLSPSVRASGAFLGAIRGPQAAALLAGRPVGEVGSFFNGLSPAVRNSGAVLGAFSAPQASAVLFSLSGSGLTAFFNGLSSGVRASIEPTLTAEQKQALGLLVVAVPAGFSALLSGDPIVAFYVGLSQGNKVGVLPALNRFQAEWLGKGLSGADLSTFYPGVSSFQSLVAPRLSVIQVSSLAPTLQGADLVSLFDNVSAVGRKVILSGANLVPEVVQAATLLNIPTSGFLPGSIKAYTFSPLENTLLGTDGFNLFRFTTGGETTQISTIPGTVTGMAFTSAGGQHRLFFTSRDSLNNFREADPSTGATLRTFTLRFPGGVTSITLPVIGQTSIIRTTALAAHPVTHKLFALLETSVSTAGRLLVTFDPTANCSGSDCTVTFLGDTRGNFSDLAFDGQGRLLAVTGQSATGPPITQTHSLFLLSQTDGQATFLRALGATSGGEGIAFNPLDGRLYHGGGGGGVRVLESLLLPSLPASLTLAQAQALLPRLSGEDLRTFFAGLPAATQSALLGGFTSAQAETLLATRTEANVAAFFNGLSAAARSAVQDNLTSAQARALASGLTGQALTDFFNGLAPGTRSAPGAAELQSLPLLNVPLSSTSFGTPRALTYFASEGVFLLSTGFSLWRLSPGGAVSATSVSISGTSKGLAFANVGGQEQLFSIKRCCSTSNFLRINPLTGSTIATFTLALPGKSVEGGTGLATHPTTGKLFALLDLGSNQNMELVTFDPAANCTGGTCTAASVGSTGGLFAGLAFDSAGRLFGLSGESNVGSIGQTNSLFLLSQADAKPTFVRKVFTTGTSDENGVSLGFNPADGRIYSASGGTLASLAVANSFLAQLTSAQAQALAAGLAGEAFKGFFNGLTPANQTALTPALTADQARAVLADQQGLGAAAFFNGLPAPIRTAVTPDLTAAQAGAVASSLSGAALTDFLGALSSQTKGSPDFAKSLTAAAPAEAAIAGLSGAALRSFFNALSKANQTAVLDNLTTAQAEFLVQGLTGEALITFFKGLPAASQTAVLNDLTPGQGAQFLLPIPAGVSGSSVDTVSGFTYSSANGAFFLSDRGLVCCTFERRRLIKVIPGDTASVVGNLDHSPNGLAFGAVGGQNKLFSLDVLGFFREVNPATGATVGSPVAVTLPGSSGFFAVNGLAIRPSDGSIFAVLGANDPTSRRHLVTINPATGAATSVGVMPFTEQIISLSFDSSGNLLGLSSSTAATPRSLFSVNTSTAAITFVRTFTTISPAGENIAVNLNDGFLYHVGSTCCGLDGRFEKFLLNPPTLPSPPTFDPNISAPDAAALVGSLTGLPLRTFYNTINAAARAAILGVLTAVQAETLLADRTAGDIGTFFNGLPAAAQAAVRAILTRAQAGALSSALTGSALADLFNALPAGARDGLLTSPGLDPARVQAFPLTDIPLAFPAGLSFSEMRALTYSPPEGVFLLSDGSRLFRLTPGGALSSIGSVSGTVKGLAFAGGKLFSILNTSSSNFREVNPQTGATLQTFTLSLPGKTIFDGNGLATHPVTGKLFAVLNLSGQTGRELVTFDPVANCSGATCTVTSLGNTGGRFAGLAFDAQGNLFGVTGLSTGTPLAVKSLFLLNQATAAATFLRKFGRGDDGEALAFNPSDGRLYHSAGSSSRIFEALGLPVLTADLTSAQATALLSAGLSASELKTLFSGLSAGARTAVLALLTAAQAEALIAGRKGADLTSFFNGLPAASQAAVLNDLTASQAKTLGGSKTGPDLVNFFNALAAGVRRGASLPDLQAAALLDIPQSFTGTVGQARALTFSAADGVFLFSDGGTLFRLTPGGQLATVANLPCCQTVHGLAFASVGGQTKLFSLLRTSSSNFREVNPLTGANVQTFTLSLPGRTISRGTGLATHPATGKLFAVLEISGQAGRQLVTFDPAVNCSGATCTVTSVGDTGGDFAGLAFDSAGRLFGVTGRSTSTPTPTSSLFLLSPADGKATFVRGLVPNAQGEAIAFNPEDGRLYQASGCCSSFAFKSIEVLNLFLFGLTQAQAQTLLPGLAGEDLKGFFTGLSAANQTALAAILTLAQAQAIAVAFSGADLVAFFNALSAPVQSGLLATLAGEPLKTVFLSFSVTRQADAFGQLSSAQQKDLAGRLSRAEMEALLGLLQPSGGAFAAAVEKSLQDLAAAATAAQLGQIVDNLTSAQAAALLNCNSAARTCFKGLGLEWADGSPSVARFFGLTLRGEDIAQGLRGEWAQRVGVDSAHVADYGDYAYRRIIRQIGLLSPQGASFAQDLNDIWGGGFLGYAVNGGVQALQLVDPPGQAAKLGGELKFPPTTRIPLSGASITDRRGLAHIPSSGDFFWATSSQLFRVTSSGAATFVGNMPSFSVAGVAAVLDGGSTRLFQLTQECCANNTTLREVNPSTGGQISSVPVTLAGKTVVIGQGLTANPQTGELFALLQLSAQSGFELAKINRATGVATAIGNTGDRFFSLAFDGSGRLFGTTGSGPLSLTRNSLFLLSQTTGAPAFVRAFNNPTSSIDALAFNPNDGRFYRNSEANGLSFESFSLSDLGYSSQRQLTSGFMAYVEQVREDFHNTGALTLIGNANPLATVAQIRGQQAQRKSLLNLVVTQLELSSIRERDALLAQIADARAGTVIRDHEGRLTRVSQYVLRPQARPDEVQVVNITDRTGLEMAYLDFRTRFAAGALAGLTSAGIRNLPWNEYLTTLYSAGNCQAAPCATLVGSPAGAPLLQSMALLRGDGLEKTDSLGGLQSGFFTFNSRSFEGTRSTADAFNFAGDLVKAALSHQKVTQEVLSMRALGAVGGVQNVLVDGTATVGGGIIPISNDPRAGSSLSTNAIPSGEFRAIPRRFAGGDPVLTASPTLFPAETQNPEGFIHRSIGAFIRQDTNLPVDFTSVHRFRALGTLSDPNVSNLVTALPSSQSMSTVKIDSMWDALRVGFPAGPQGLSALDLGGNLLQFADHENVYIPWSRMIWRDAGGF